MNKNGQRLLEFCCHHGFCINNTFFNTKPQYRVSWKHPRSKHWHQLHLILTMRSCLPSIKLTRSCHSADCHTDYSLVCSKVKLRIKKLYRSRKVGTETPHRHQHDTRPGESGGICTCARGYSLRPVQCKCQRKMGTLQGRCLQCRHVHLWQEG